MGIPIEDEPELDFQNGTFEDATSWELGDKWVIAGGKATYTDDGTPFGNFMRQLLDGVLEHVYRVRFTISNVILTGGSHFRLQLFGATLLFTIAGTYEVFMTATNVGGGLGLGLHVSCDEIGGPPNSFDLDDIEIIDMMFIVAIEMNFLNMKNSKSEIQNIGDSNFMMLTANFEGNTNILTTFDGSEL